MGISSETNHEHFVLGKANKNSFLFLILTNHKKKQDSTTGSTGNQQNSVDFFIVVNVSNMKIDVAYTNLETQKSSEMVLTEVKNEKTLVLSLN